jgi:hypothetical protein
VGIASTLEIVDFVMSFLVGFVTVNWSISRAELERSIADAVLGDWNRIQIHRVNPTFHHHHHHPCDSDHGCHCLLVRHS